MPQTLTYLIDDNAKEEWQTITNGDADATIGSGGTVMLASANTSPRTINLPASGDNKDRMISVTKVDGSGNSVTVSPDGSDTINGNASHVLATQNDAIMIITDGTGDWRII